MAILPNDNKQLNQGQTDPTQQAGQTTGSVGGAGGSMGGGGGASSSPAFGAGGASPWTNLQNYLSANQGNTGSAQALNSTVGDAFKQDQSNLQSQSDQTKQQAQSAVDQNNMSQDKASQLIQDAGKQYSYSGPQSDAYNQATGQIKDTLSATYGGPSSFNYGLSSQSQNYGQSLGNDQNFQGVMQDVYNKSAGGPMGSGALALQNQLDTNNQAVNDTRNSLMQQYAGLGQNVADTTAATNAALAGSANQFTQHQQALKDYLTGQQTSDQSALNQRVTDINNFLNGYNTNVTSADTAETNVLNQMAAQTTGGTLHQPGGSDVAVPGATYSVSDGLSGPSAAISNIGGMDDQRNQYNTIADALGLGNKIVRDSNPYSLNNVTETQSILQNGNPNSQTQTNLGQLMSDPNSPYYQAALALGILGPQQVNTSQALGGLGGASI